MDPRPPLGATANGRHARLPCPLSYSPTAHESPPCGASCAHAQNGGRARPANDTWIAACCLARDLPLATLNVKDFADFA
jgi:predicted nucleic acid-binding protein